MSITALTNLVFPDLRGSMIHCSLVISKKHKRSTDKNIYLGNISNVGGLFNLIGDINIDVSPY